MKEKQQRAKQSISYQKARHERAAFAFITRDINQNTRGEREKKTLGLRKTKQTQKE